MKSFIKFIFQNCKILVIVDWDNREMVDKTVLIHQKTCATYEATNEEIPKWSGGLCRYIWNVKRSKDFLKCGKTWINEILDDWHNSGQYDSDIDPKKTEEILKIFFSIINTSSIYSI